MTVAPGGSPEYCTGYQQEHGGAWEQRWGDATNWRYNYARLDSSEMRKLSWPLRGRPWALRCRHLEGLLVVVQPHGGLGGRGRSWQLQVGTLVSYWQRGRKL